LRRRYIWNLTEVVKGITDKVPLVAMGGPTLYGEVMPRGSNPSDQKFEEYCAINRRICKRFNVTYLETRNLFFANLPRYAHTHTHTHTYMYIYIYHIQAHTRTYIYNIHIHA